MAGKSVSKAARLVALVLLVLTCLAGCGGSVTPADADACGWELADVGFAGSDWDHADIADSCGYLPLGVSPCDMTPVRQWENDGGAVTGWRRSQGVVCSPVLTLRP